VLITIIAKMLGGFWGLRLRYAAAKAKSLRKFYYFVYTYSLQRKGSWISLDARFSGEPFFPHGVYGIFISGEAVLAKNCVIFQQVTIGSNTLMDSKRVGAPVIGENCYIGTGAKIIGKVEVGNNVRVGANAVVYQDVPDNSVVTCGSQRIAQKAELLNNKFYHKHRGEWVFYDDGKRCKVLSPDEVEKLNGSFPD
jgi:serine O-acetyltransferase